MTSQWAKSFSYREALDGLTAQFAALASQDRLVNHELMPNIHSVDGFLFAINSAPANVSPTEWLGELLPLLQPEQTQSGQMVSMLISYAQHCKSRMEQQKYALPEATDPLKALAPASPMNSFSHGFEVGYRKIESIWSASIAEELRSELNAQVFALKFFSSTEHATAYLKERDSKMRPDQLAEQVLSNLPKAADLHVRLGMSLSLDQSQRH
jgi:uncharacterized protein YecA (UPF0149 family)